MKRPIAILTVLCLLFGLALPCLAAGITSAPTPTGTAELLFARKLGTGYRNAPTPIAAGDGVLYVAAGKNFYKLDAATGETLASVPMESVSTYTAVPPLLVDDTVYMPLDDGLIQAFSAEDLTPLWTYTDPLGGQSLTPIVYEDGYLYTGFWNGETEEANFVCLPAEGSGEQEALWTFSHAGGFYRTAPLLVGNYLIVGSDNGQRVDRPEAPSALYALHKRTGRQVSSLATAGDLRAGVGYDETTGACYTVSKAGILYRFLVNPATGALSGLTSAALPGGSTVTPIPRNGRLYTAGADGRKGVFSVRDPATLAVICAAELPGPPQGDMLLSTAYEADGGRVLLYATYNAPPGGVCVMEDAPGRTEITAAELFTPPEDMGQYCFCPLTADARGRLYYKNDSGNIFGLDASPEGKQAFSLLEQFLRLLEKLLAFLKGLTTL